MGVPTTSLSFAEMLEIAKARGNELKEFEKLEKTRIAKEKAEKLIQLTLAKRNRATTGVIEKLGQAFSIPISAWKIENESVANAANFNAYLVLGARLRLYFISSRVGNSLIFRIKKTGYSGSWDSSWGYAIKPCPNWDEFCKIVATYGGKFEDAV